MAQVHRADDISPEQHEKPSTYEILSEGHFQASAHRTRSFSLHSSRLSSKGTKNKNYHRRRMSLPPDESNLSFTNTRSSIDNDLIRLEKEEDIRRRRTRRSGSFDERQEMFEVEHRRVRSFKTTPKGLIFRVDSLNIHQETKQKEQDILYKDIDDTVRAFHNFVIPQITGNKYIVKQTHFRVLLTGARDVGKTTLIDQFLTSGVLGSGDLNVSQSEGERTVTLQVDGEESTLEFVQSEDFQDQDESFQIDGFVVVYCITERATFDIAIDLLKQIRDEVGSNKAIILVGNKSDLVRKRTISQEEGRSAADAYGCKYIELSAALNHRVDELLVGIHKQIKLKSDAENEELECKIPKGKERKSSFKRTKRFLEKVFLGHSGKDKKTENLYVD
ncbi:uncharacterized protein LOC132722833 isoform X2 [Ruditapes philippinarum]|uniref:uncharacterized protein LOC132722833 isoform X2 n=1 Tax=Ruditapes philippinarum TaxID=129788 RepID=UPI00295A9F56|nr:uncharacterized protein LOC132722833 isoform X2 [Ruditapes philippinarum]